jgi:hypothetical protein
LTTPAHPALQHRAFAAGALGAPHSLGLGIRCATAGAALLIAAIFLPCIFFLVVVVGFVAGGWTNLWAISPLLSSLIILLIAAAVVTAIRQQSNELPSALLTTGIFLAIACAIGISVLLLGILPIHPYALAAVLVAAVMFVVAAFTAKRPGQAMRFRFHLRTLLLCVTVAAMALAALRNASN